MASQIQFKGRTLMSPAVIILSSDANSLIGYVAGSDATKRAKFKNVFEKVKEYQEEGTVLDLPKKLRFYFSAKGSFKDLVYQGYDGENILIGSESNPKKYKPSSLQPGAFKFAKRYQKKHNEIKVSKALNGLKSKFLFPEDEEWKSAEGKVVTAKFKSLSDQGTLILTKGKKGYSQKVFKLPIDKFDADSQNKAKKWKEVLATQEEQLKKATEDALKSKG